MKITHKKIRAHWRLREYANRCIWPHTYITETSPVLPRKFMAAFSWRQYTKCALLADGKITGECQKLPRPALTPSHKGIADSVCGTESCQSNTHTRTNTNLRLHNPLRLPMDICDATRSSLELCMHVHVLFFIPMPPPRLPDNRGMHRKYLYQFF